MRGPRVTYRILDPGWNDSGGAVWGFAHPGPDVTRLSASTAPRINGNVSDACRLSGVSIGYFVVSWTAVKTQVDSEAV